MTVQAGSPVIGEAVELDLRPATFASRAISGALDLLVQAVLLVVIFLLDSWLVSGMDDAAAGALLLVSGIAVIVGYPLIWETLTRGRTVGKFAMGLRTVRDDGGPIRFRQALVRALLEVVEIWVLYGVPALICSLISARGKRIGDLLAGTYVVRERGVALRGYPPQMPPHLIGWAQVSDIGRIPDRLAISVRQFLSRAAGMRVEVRASLGWALAQEVTTYVAPPPPAGTHPEAYLSAVLAERRRRDEIRLAHEAALIRRLTGRLS